MGEVREGGFQVKSALACVGSNDLRRALRDAMLKDVSPKYHKNSKKYCTCGIYGPSGHTCYGWFWEFGDRLQHTKLNLKLNLCVRAKACCL